MEKHICNTTLTPIERETIITYNDEERKWQAETAVPKHYRRFIKQGWTQVSETTTTDGKFIAAEFEACDKALSIGRAERPKREMSPERLEALRAGLKSRKSNSCSENT